jgi:hypothetical protein
MRANDFIKKIIQSEDFKKFKQEMYENGNVTANVDGYQTPNAFAKSEEEFEKTSKDRIEVFGYKKVEKTKPKHFKPVYKVESKSTYKELMDILGEVSYKEYKTDETKSVNRKINDSIKNINKTIYEVERVVEHALKLKTEMNIDQRTLWGSSMNRLRKISERINRITKKINELGA